MKNDIKINKENELYQINEVAKVLNIDEKYLECYGKYKAKINLEIMNDYHNSNGKLILVTSMNPTKYGEGKTTISIGLNDALCMLGKKSIVALREPSLGPVFGTKGGATGAGKARIVPKDDIDLHFTGDIHAIEACNNLLCAIIDNHIFQGNLLNLDSNEIYVRRCIDINDRELRSVTLKNGRQESFVITAASEIMAIVCLAKDIDDLRKRLENILIGKNKSGKPVFARELNCIDALLILLKDAIKPNLVQTLEHNPALVHGGPFANIAHGCSSIIATSLGLLLADYVVTEAGFGADLGAIKFFDIKNRILKHQVDAVVMNVTIRAIKYHGSNSLKEGMENVKIHLSNIEKYTNNIVVTINKFEDDKEEDLKEVITYINNLGYKCTICDSYKNGGKGALDLANEVINICENKTNVKDLYDINDSIKNKIEIICKKIFRTDVEYSDKAIEKIKWLEENNLYKYPLCIAKTPYSLSDDPLKLNATSNFKLTVTDISLSRGAGFIVVYMGNILLMPGFTEKPAYLNMKFSNN